MATTPSNVSGGLSERHGKQMFGLTVDPCPLSRVFASMTDRADECWWFLRGQGMSLPPSAGALNPADQSELMNQQIADYPRWVIHDRLGGVGAPGWFSRYADFAATNWAVYFGCDPTQDGKPSQDTLRWLDEFSSEGTDWFGDAVRWRLPSDVAFVCRDIDDARWDLFVRHEEDFAVILDDLAADAELNCRPFEEPPG